ncbi:unnamed protein product [Closterium sp. NIES-54]
MEVARTSMIHAAAPHFLWPFAVRYAAHQLNLWPRVSLPETSPTLRWTGQVGDASVFRDWGVLSLVHDTTASKLPPRTLRCVFLGFPTDATPWQFYHPSSRRVFSSEDFTFDESVCYYRLHPHASHPVPLAPLFLGPAPSGVSQAEGEGSGGAATGGAGSGGAETGGADSGGAASPGGGGGSTPAGAGATSLGGAGGTAGGTGAAGGGGAGAAGHGGPASARGAAGGTGAAGAVGAGAAGAGGAGGAGGTAGAGGTGGATGAGGTRAAGAGGTGAVVAGGAGAAGPGGPASAGGAGGPAGGAGGAAGAGGTRGATGAGGTGATSPTGPRGAGGATSAGGTGAAGAGGAVATGAGGAGGDGGAAGAGDVGATTAGGTGAASAGGHAGTGGTGPAGALRHLLGLLPAPTEFPVAGTAPPLLIPQLLPNSPLPAPAPYTAVTESLTERGEPKTRASTPERREPETRASTLERREPETRVSVCVRVPHVRRSRAPAVPGTHDMTLRPSSVPQRVVLPSPPESSLPAVADPPSDLARVSSPTITPFLATVVTDPTLSSPTASALVAELVDFAATYCLDYLACLVSDPDPPCPPSVGGEVALGCDVLQDRQEELECLAAAAPHLATMLLAHEGDPDALDIPTPRSYREAISAQRDYELHSLDFSTAFLQGSLHEAIWLRHPPGFTGSFPEVTQWSLRRPVYGLRQAPREWHDTLRMTLAALGFAPSTANPSLFLCTDTSLPPFYVLVYVDDLVFATADTEALALVKAKLQKRHTCTDLGKLPSYFGLQITRDRARCQ